MWKSSSGYLAATRHPWACLVFVLPLLACYEGGVYWLGGAHPEDLRNGADAWVRLALEKLSLQQYDWAPPALIALAFLIWTFFRLADKPSDLVGLICGMTLESVAFALGLWCLGSSLLAFFEASGFVLSTGPSQEVALSQVITYVGAGIYEEVLFRLILLTALRWVLLVFGVPEIVAVLVAMVGSAAMFSLAHHVGPFGEAFDRKVFTFRMMAGLYFAAIYQTRGFGISAGAHACYDVMVGVGVG